MALATDDLAKAIKGAGIIIVATVAIAHEAIFRELIPLLEDGQVIHILPDNCGTLIFRKLMRELKSTAKVIVGSWYTAPYGIRVVKRGGVTTNECKVEDRITTIRGCALPAKDNEAFMASAFYIPAFGAIIDAGRRRSYRCEKRRRIPSWFRNRQYCIGYHPVQRKPCNPRTWYGAGRFHHAEL